MSKERATWGLLDYIDIVVGRLSKSDTTGEGKRKRSWSATVLFWCLLPSIILLFSVCFRVVYSTVRAPTVSVEARSSNNTKKRGTAKGQKQPVLVKKLLGGIQLPESGYLGWPEVLLAVFLALLGFTFSVMSNEHDMKRVERLGSLVAAVKHGDKTSPETISFLEKSLKEVTSKVTGVSQISNETTDKPKVEVPYP